MRTNTTSLCAGAKLQYGHVPLHTRGDDPGAKTFASLHAVQRHMVDSNRCGVAYDGNEDEYEEFYDYECVFWHLLCFCQAFRVTCLGVRRVHALRMRVRISGSKPGACTVAHARCACE
jgi:hypothetical protein